MALPELPTSIKKASHGVCYWIGHRRSMYRYHPLTEGAIVAELCNLINANIRGEFVINCEVMFGALLDSSDIAAPLTARGKADLVIYSHKKNSQGMYKKSPKCVIEIKRGSSSNESINDDLRRLEVVNSALPKARTMLIVVSEASRPNRFVNKNGRSRKIVKDIPNGKGGKYRVRGTWKALYGSSKRSIDNGCYACVIETFAND